MLHAPALPLEISIMDLSAPRGFAVPSPTNISRLNNFPFASPDINEPGSPLGYDLNSSLLDPNLESFSNSLLDINESTEAHGLNFSPSSDLNLSPQDSPIFQLFTGPSLELGLPRSSEPPAPYIPSKATRPLSLQRAPFIVPLQDCLGRPHESYANLSSEDIIQQKRDDAFWAAFFFFQHYFEPVLVEGDKDLSFRLNGSLPNAGPGVDRQVFVVQNDLENVYMWFLSARPANVLGRMQLQGYINGRQQPGQAAFPYSSAMGFVRSHKLQRKRYKGLSNPQCIHGLRAVNSPIVSNARPEDWKRFEELTSRPLGTALPPEAADYNVWRKIPERGDGAASPVESTSQTIQFLPGQDAQKRTSKPPTVTEPESGGSKGGARAAKRRRKGPASKNGAASDGQGNAATAEAVHSGVQGLDCGETGGASGVSDERSEVSLAGQSALEAEREAGGSEQRQEAVNRAATPVTDLTLQWRAGNELSRPQVWGRTINSPLVPRIPDMRQPAQQPAPVAAAQGVQQHPRSSGRDCQPEKGLGGDRVVSAVDAFAPSTCSPLGGRRGTEAAVQSVAPEDSRTNDRRDPSRRTAGGNRSRVYCEWAPGETRAAVETLSEDGHPQDELPSAARAEGFQAWQQGLQSPLCQPAYGVAPPGAGDDAVARGLQRACSEVLYEDEHGYLLCVSLPFTNLQRVRVTWRNVGETGIVKLDGLGPARVVARGKRVLRLSNWGCGGAAAAREIMLPTRIPDDSSIEAHFSAECAGLEVFVPKHAACTEERPVRLFLPEQRQHTRTS